jgi:hypothetical protein
MSAVITAAVALTVGTVYSITQSQEGKKNQEKAMQQQKQAQEQAVAQAESQSRKSEFAMNAANRRMPDISSIMANAAKAASGGPSGTMLTGPGGVNQNALALGKNTLLGG